MSEHYSLRKKFSIDFLIAGIGGSFAQTLLAPLSTIKLILDPNFNSKYPKNIQKNLNSFKNSFKLVFSSFKEQGFSFLWKDNKKNAIHAFFAQGIFFSVKQIANKFINLTYENDLQSGNLIGNFLSGAIGATATTTVLYPTQWPRILMIQMKGIKDLYQRFWIHLIPVVIYRGTQIAIFDSYKQNLKEKDDDSSWKFFVFGIFTTFCSQVVSYPFWDMKTIEAVKKADKTGIRTYYENVRKNFLSSIKQCLKLRYFLLIRTLRASISLSFFETGKENLHKLSNLNLHDLDRFP